MLEPIESHEHSVHTAYGLRFRSRLDWLPVNRADDRRAGFDVDVTVGTVPPGLGQEAYSCPRYDALPGRLLYRTRTIANYLIEEGCRISVQPKPDSEKLKLSNILFGAATGALLIQRGTLALHGCSVETASGAVIICGDSGAGKSTLATLLLQRGLRVLDDNLAVLIPAEGGFQVQPGLGFLRLTAETLELLNEAPRGPAFDAPFEKKYLHFLDRGEFCSEPRLLRHLFVLDRKAPLFCLPLEGRDKFAAARRFTFVGHMAPGLGRTEDLFRRWLELAARTPMSVLGLPPEVPLYSWADSVSSMIREL